MTFRVFSFARKSYWSKTMNVTTVVGMYSILLSCLHHRCSEKRLGPLLCLCGAHVILSRSLATLLSSSLLPRPRALFLSNNSVNLRPHMDWNSCLPSFPQRASSRVCDEEEKIVESEGRGNERMNLWYGNIPEVFAFRLDRSAFGSRLSFCSPHVKSNRGGLSSPAGIWRSSVESEKEKVGWRARLS